MSDIEESRQIHHKLAVFVEAISLTLRHLLRENHLAISAQNHTKSRQISTLGDSFDSSNLLNAFTMSDTEGKRQIHDKFAVFVEANSLHLAVFIVYQFYRVRSSDVTLLCTRQHMLCRSK